MDRQPVAHSQFAIEVEVLEEERSVDVHHQVVGEPADLRVLAQHVPEADRDVVRADQLGHGPTAEAPNLDDGRLSRMLVRRPDGYRVARASEQVGQLPDADTGAGDHIGERLVGEKKNLQRRSPFTHRSSPRTRITRRW